MRALRAAGDAALVGDRDEQLEVDKVEAHLGSLQPSFQTKAFSVSYRLCRRAASVNVQK